MGRRPGRSRGPVAACRDPRRRAEHVEDATRPAILAGVLAAAGAALAVSEVTASIDDGDAETIGLVGAVALLVVLAIAYALGGCAAGRMARSDDARQGVGAWVWGIVAAILATLVAALLGGSGGERFDRRVDRSAPERGGPGDR